uniref:Uncharacterized protein n=1 Tax=Candidatus Kentrum sp. UNK TaxID=2126344 RepID=A0A451AG06_9GAMM|nr:MAG: hypothetical protein BECKUNK1418G_GA0071005_105418 [Candidatus Kentron sp. UNK]
MNLIRQSKENYGGEFNQHLFEQYKLYVKMAGQPNETTFQLTLTYLRQKYSPSKGHESKFWT